MSAMDRRTPCSASCSLIRRRPPSSHRQTRMYTAVLCKRRKIRRKDAVGADEVRRKPEGAGSRRTAAGVGEFPQAPRVVRSRPARRVGPEKLLAERLQVPARRGEPLANEGRPRVGDKVERHQRGRPARVAQRTVIAAAQLDGILGGVEDVVVGLLGRPGGLGPRFVRLVDQQLAASAVNQRPTESRWR